VEFYGGEFEVLTSSARIDADLSMSNNLIDSISIAQFYDTNGDGVYWAVYEKASGSDQKLYIQSSNTPVAAISADTSGNVYLPRLQADNTAATLLAIDNDTIKERSFASLEKNIYTDDGTVDDIHRAITMNASVDSFYFSDGQHKFGYFTDWPTGARVGFGWRGSILGDATETYDIGPHITPGSSVTWQMYLRDEGDEQTFFTARDNFIRLQYSDITTTDDARISIDQDGISLDVAGNSQVYFDDLPKVVDTITYALGLEAYSFSDWAIKRVPLTAIGAIDSLNNLEDVNITTPSDSTLLFYDSANGEWIDGVTVTELRTGGTTAQIDSVSMSGDTIVVTESGTPYSTELKLRRAIEGVTPPTDTTITIDIDSYYVGVFQIDMTSASTTATIVLSAPTNPVDGGVYTFHWQNTTATNSVDLPATFLDETGTALDGGTTYDLTADEWFTCYYDGTNYYCK